MTNFAFAAQACRDLGITSAMIAKEVETAKRLGLDASAALVGALQAAVFQAERAFRADHVVVMDRYGDLVARCNDAAMAQRIADLLNDAE